MAVEIGLLNQHILYDSLGYGYSVHFISFHCNNNYSGNIFNSAKGQYSCLLYTSCVMFKKSAVESVGSYRTCMQYEDYDLWVRMFQSGMQGYNIQNTLLWMRVGNGFYRRRSGFDYFKKGLSFQRRLLRTGFISRGRFLWNVICRFTVQSLPLDLCERFYRHFLRSGGPCR